MRHLPTKVMRGLAVAVAALSGCSGGGPGGGGGPGPSVLFVADTGHGAIASFAELDPAPDSTITGRVISGITGLGNALAYDAGHDQLYAASGSTVRVYAGASLASGTPAPARTIVPSGVSLVGSGTLFLDVAHDRIYLGGDQMYGGCIVAIENASTANGTVAPSRTMTISEGVRQFTVDPGRSMLYIVNSLMGVHVYEGVDTASGVLTPARHVLTSRIPTGVAIDSVRDRLYAAGMLYPDPTMAVMFVDGASVATMASSYGVVLVPGAQFATFDAAHDRLYVGAGAAAYVVDDASTLTNGASPPGSTTGLAPAGSNIAGFAFP